MQVQRFPKIFHCLVLAVLFSFALRGHAGQVYVVSVSGDQVRRVTTDDGRLCGSCRWSPDGKEIAFDTWPIGEEFQAGEIAIVDSQGGPMRILGPGAMPSWSPDGKQLVCHTYLPERQIVVMNVDGSGREAILDQWGCPCWSPDGRTIVTLYLGGLASFDFATGTQTILLNNYGVRPGFSYSPVSHRYCIPTMNPSLMIVEKEEGTEKWLPRERHRTGTTYLPESRVGHASWAPDGNRIVFAVGDIKKKCRLYNLNADDTLPPTEVPGLPADWICCNPSWSPDGESIAFIRMVPGEEK